MPRSPDGGSASTARVFVSLKKDIWEVSEIDTGGGTFPGNDSAADLAGNAIGFHFCAADYSGRRQRKLCIARTRPLMSSLKAMARGTISAMQNVVSFFSIAPPFAHTPHLYLPLDQLSSA